MTKSLRKHRHENGLSMEKLGGMSNVTRGTIGNVEKRRTTPSFETIASVSDALGIHPSEVSEFAPVLGIRDGHEAATQQAASAS